MINTINLINQPLSQRTGFITIMVMVRNRQKLFDEIKVNRKLKKPFEINIYHAGKLRHSVKVKTIEEIKEVIFMHQQTFDGNIYNHIIESEVELK